MYNNSYVNIHGLTGVYKVDDTVVVLPSLYEIITQVTMYCGISDSCYLLEVW